LKTEILFRSEAGNVTEVGTGHLFRSITIAKILKKKYNLKKKQIKFITKNEKNFKISSKILRQNNIYFKIYKDRLLKENSLSEIDILKKNPAKLLIIDRWGNTEKKTILKIKKYFHKIILFDDKCKHSKYNLKVNALINNKKDKNIKKFKSLIIPSYLYKKFIKKKIKKNVKNIFLSFGGYDKNGFKKKILKIFKKSELNLNLFIPSSLIKKTKIIKHRKLNIIYFKNKDFYKYLNMSDISIVSGGLTQFDSLLFRIPTICLPQYNHQLINAKIINKFKSNLIINPNNIEKSLMYNFNNLYKSYGKRKKLIKNGKKIVNLNNMKNIINKIFKIYEK